MLIISIQSRSLWVRLLTIPTRVILIRSIRTDKSSGLVVLIFIIIFIGGLLVLLVRVTSTVYQEQGLAPRGFVFLTVSYFIFLILTSLKGYDCGLVKANLFYWLNGLKIRFLFFCRRMVLIRLAVITLLLIEFKGVIRKL